MTLSRALLITLASLSLGACKTADGLVSDIGTSLNLDSGTSPYATPDVAVAHSNDPCPQVQIVDELSALSEFSSAKNTSEDNLVSRVNLQHVESACSFQTDQVSVDMKMAFESALGPKGKLRSNDIPFFSYPFFIAVADPEGIIMAKEVFSASMTYARNEKTHTHYENMRQLIPMPRREDARRHKVLLGLQLDPAQLAYNRKNM